MTLINFDCMFLALQVRVVFSLDNRVVNENTDIQRNRCAWSIDWNDKVWNGVCTKYIHCTYLSGGSVVLYIRLGECERFQIENTINSSVIHYENTDIQRNGCAWSFESLERVCASLTTLFHMVVKNRNNRCYVTNYICIWRVDIACF